MVVLLNRPLGHSQFVSDFSISQAATNQQRDLELARAQELRPVVHKVRLIEEQRATHEFLRFHSRCFGLPLLAPAEQTQRATVHAHTRELRKRTK